MKNSHDYTVKVFNSKVKTEVGTSVGWQGGVIEYFVQEVLYKTVIMNTNLVVVSWTGRKGKLK